MRIAIIDMGGTVGGTLTVAANIVRGLQRFGEHDITAIVAVPRAVAEPYFDGGAKVKQVALPYNYVRSRKLKHAFERVPFLSRFTRPLGLLLDEILQPLNALYDIRLMREIRRLKPDVVHLNNGSPLAISLLARLNIPIVFHLHGLVPTKLGENVQRCFEKVTRFVAISECVEQSYLSAGLDPSRVTVINNFVPPVSRPAMDRSEAKRLLGIPDDGDLIGFVGRIVPWKGPREFVAAMALLIRERPAIRLLLVGDSSETPDYEMNLRKQIAEAGIESRVTFISHLSDTFCAYRACSVFVHASIEPEPFGMVIVEAMQAGTPVVAASSGGPVEILEHGISGLLADPKDPHALASAVRTLLEDADLRTSVIQAGERRVAERFGMERSIARLLQLYQSLIAGGSPSEEFAK